MRSSPTPTLSLLALLALACSEAPTATWEPTDDVLVGSATTIPGLASAEGVLGPGALYQILVPPAWNGTLVLYAHGYVDPDGPPSLPDPTDPFDSEGQLVLALTQLGFATAYSSFSENGLAIKDGTQRTKQLRGIFVSEFGRPARTLVMGASLGGAITLDLVEGFPQHYAGGLALCGLVGGSRAEIDYMSNVRVLFDVFYPGVIPGDLFNLPPEASRPGVLAAAAAAVTANPTGAVFMQGIMAGLGTPIPGAVGPELVQSVLTALAFNLTRFEDVLARTRGHVFFDNSDTDYGDPLVNAMVDRFTATPDALNYLEQYYQPSGDLRIPLVTLHTTDDPTVPVFHEGLLAQAVAAAGSSALLDQIVVTRYGHCDFLPYEVLGAFQLLLARMGS